LDEAASFLSNRSTDDVIEYFREAKATKDTPSVRSLKEDTDRLSKVVQDMAESDPERYRILSEFKRMIRTGEALSSFGEIKRLGMTNKQELRAC